LEAYLAGLQSEVSELQKRGETLRAEYTRFIAAGDADSALSSKKELESLPVKVEILGVRIAAAESKLSQLKASEPQALQIRTEMGKLWTECKAIMDSVDSNGEQIRQAYAKLRSTDASLWKLLGQYYSLIGLTMPYSPTPLAFYEASQLPKFLTENPPRPVSLHILQRPWEAWIPPTP